MAITIEQEMFGFTAEINRQGRLTVRLTFEEIFPKRISSRSKKKYYCLVEFGLYNKTIGLDGNYAYSFERTGSLEFKDWFMYDKERAKREKVKKAIGVSSYNMLLERLDTVVNGNRAISV